MALFTKTITEAFSEYLKAKTPKQWERDEVTKYRARIHEVLDREYGVLSFFQSGSFSNGTGITQKSDVDYFTRIPLDRKTTLPASFLNSMKELLKRELWEAYDVRVSRPTVCIDFRQMVTQYEITPAFYCRTGHSEQDVFLIPGPGNSWREAAPKAHLEYVRTVDGLHGGKVKGLTRLLKAWKYENSVPISSFYLEMRAAQYGGTAGDFTYPYALLSLVRTMIDNELRSMNDPTGLVNRITPCGSEADRLSVMRSMKSALPHLLTACEKWTVNDSEASQEYQAVFGASFPTVV
ncbi:nucleotidyltransferase [Streptomyces sp. NBC_01077]|uniref:nucleotidyltransferase domain-containing protein n=1 Tax=Streptomyces sp. NBC_01077 TaxID=2903746 RepID=UPI003868B0A6|nr:nucleotidyltransferase [Streptomyces sp. NBC_01077]